MCAKDGICYSNDRADSNLCNRRTVLQDHSGSISVQAPFLRVADAKGGYRPASGCVRLRVGARAMYYSALMLRLRRSGTVVHFFVFVI